MPFQNLDINWEQDLIIPALQEFYASPDGELLRITLHERNLVAHIYFYMRCRFEQLERDTANLSIDCEYNRNYTNSKKCYAKCNGCNEVGCIANGMTETGMIPDILIHHRGDNDNNQVAIEFKKKFRKESAQSGKDTAKLSFLTCQSGDANDQNDYKYRFGYLINLWDDYFYITKYEDHIASEPRRIQCSPAMQA